MLALRSCTLSDSLVAVSALSKGRSSTGAMNRLCQQSAAYQLASGIEWHVRHIETLRNPSDRPSRRFEPPSQKLPDFEALTKSCSSSVGGCGSQSDAKNCHGVADTHANLAKEEVGVELALFSSESPFVR